MALDYPENFREKVERVLFELLPEKKEAISKDLEEGSELIAQHLQEAMQFSVSAHEYAEIYEEGGTLELYRTAIKSIQAKTLLDEWNKIYHSQQVEPEELRS